MATGGASISKSWEKRLENERYKNWLKVGYAFKLTCDGMRPCIEGQAKAFHTSLTTNLFGAVPCGCTFLAVRRRNRYHDMSTCAWANELERHHTKGSPEWGASDGTKWTHPNDGYLEIAKLYMPDYFSKGKVKLEEIDGTGLLHLLVKCDHFNAFNPVLAKSLRETRNKWAHSSQQEFDPLDKTDAFLSMINFLKGPVLATDPNAMDALKKIKDLENENLIDVKKMMEMEVQVAAQLGSFISAFAGLASASRYCDTIDGVWGRSPDRHVSFFDRDSGSPDHHCICHHRYHNYFSPFNPLNWFVNERCDNCCHCSKT